MWYITECDVRKLNSQRPTVSWKLFSGCFINAVMTTHASSKAEYGCIAISNNFILGSGIKQYHRKTQFGSIRLKIFRSA